MTSYAKKVLLINDQHLFLESCADYLKVDQGLYHLILATSGREALDILNREEVALILHDRCQSDPPGFDVMAEIQSHWPRIKTFSMKSLGRAPAGEGKRGTEGSGFDEASPGFEWVRQRILEEIIKKEEGFEGTLKNFQLADLIQMCCLSGVSSRDSGFPGLSGRNHLCQKWGDHPCNLQRDHGGGGLLPNHLLEKGQF